MRRPRDNANAAPADLRDIEADDMFQEHRWVICDSDDMRGRPLAANVESTPVPLAFGVLNA